MRPGFLGRVSVLDYGAEEAGSREPGTEVGSLDWRQPLAAGRQRPTPCPPLQGPWSQARHAGTGRRDPVLPGVSVHETLLVTHCVAPSHLDFP